MYFVTQTSNFYSLSFSFFWFSLALTHPEYPPASSAPHMHTVMQTRRQSALGKGRQAALAMRLPITPASCGVWTSGLSPSVTDGHQVRLKKKSPNLRYHTQIQPRGGGGRKKKKREIKTFGSLCHTERKHKQPVIHEWTLSYNLQKPFFSGLPRTYRMAEARGGEGGLTTGVTCLCQMITQCCRPICISYKDINDICLSEFILK